MAMLEVKNLGISFGGLRAVDDFHISIEKGQLYGLIGPNGAGILPCEARTFLTPAMLGRDHLFYLSPQLLLIIMCFPQNVKAILYIEAGTADEFADNRILADTVARHRKEIIQKLEQALCLQIFRTILVNGKQQRLGIHL